MYRKPLYSILGLACSATLLCVIVWREPINNGAAEALSSTPGIQMPDSNVWRQSETADDDFLSSPTTFAHGSNHLSGTLSLKDMMPTEHSDINDDEHPSVDGQGSKGVSSHWPKNLLLDTRPAPRMRAQSTDEATEDSAAGSSAPIQARPPLRISPPATHRG